MIEPLEFKYNIAKSRLLWNQFEVESTSTGLSYEILYTLSSSNLLIHGVLFTLQHDTDHVTSSIKPVVPTPILQNATIIASHHSTTIGMISYVNYFEKRVKTENRIPKKNVGINTSNVTSASGIFESYKNGNVIIINDNLSQNRTIRISP